MIFDSSFGRINSKLLEGAAGIVVESSLKTLSAHGSKDNCFNEHCAKGTFGSVLRCLYFIKLFVVTWKVIAVSPQAVSGSLQTIVTSLVTLIIDATRSPVNPKYNHYLFEALVCSFRRVYKLIHLKSH